MSRCLRSVAPIMGYECHTLCASCQNQRWGGMEGNVLVERLWQPLLVAGLPAGARDPGQARWGWNRATEPATGWEIIMEKE